VLFNLADFDKGKIKDAEALGIPITKIANTMNAYAQSVEARFEIIAKNLPTPTDIKNAMDKAILDAQQRQREAYKKAIAEGGGQGGGGDVDFFKGVLKEVMGGGGGGSDEELRKLQIEMYRANIDSIKHRADLSDKVVEAVISKIVAKGVKDIV